MTVQEYLSKRIRELRSAAGVSQETVAKALHIAPNTLSRWETGQYKPAIEDICALAQYFHVSPATFLEQEPSNDDENTELLRKLATVFTEEQIAQMAEYSRLHRGWEASYRKAGRPAKEPK